MGCDELRQLLLYTDWRENDSLSNCVVTHMRTCPHCHHGQVRFIETLIGDDPFDPLSCDQCRSCFPDYYEATRPEYPLVTMPNAELAQVAFHLSHCASCHEEYEELVLLSGLEERDEMVDK
jgi:hypothetical protein